MKLLSRLNSILFVGIRAKVGFLCLSRVSVCIIVFDRFCVKGVFGFFMLSKS